MILKDQTYRTLELFKTPKRIISLVPSQTELLIDLGLEDSIVGILPINADKNLLNPTKYIGLTFLSSK